MLNISQSKEILIKTFKKKFQSLIWYNKKILVRHDYSNTGCPIWSYIYLRLDYKDTSTAFLFEELNFYHLLYEHTANDNQVVTIFK